MVQHLSPLHFWNITLGKGCFGWNWQDITFFWIFLGFAYGRFPIFCSQWSGFYLSLDQQLSSPVRGFRTVLFPPNMNNWARIKTILRFPLLLYYSSASCQSRLQFEWLFNKISFGVPILGVGLACCPYSNSEGTRSYPDVLLSCFILSVFQ